MSKFKLAFGIHNHQPVGNFEAVFEEAHTHAYLPFLKLVSRNKNFRMSLHQSGILWDWQKKNHPDYLDLVKKMVRRGQVELMTGGFYEPILCAIPWRDVKGQIELLTEYIKNNFDTDAKGLWLTERVWEPHMPELLAHSKVEYAPVDDAHFIYAGFEQSKLNEPYISESNGSTVKLLPIQKRLRYLIPFGTIEELVSDLRKQAEKNPDGLAVYADDGEKFGVWPNTYKHCFENGWLESFLEAIDKNSDWLEVIPLGEAAKRKTVGRAYLPSASYSEMLHWSLPADAFVEYEQFEHLLKENEQFERYGRFVRGGHWRNFLSKYDESNLMHKKMLYISNKLESAVGSGKYSKNEIKTMSQGLYAGQCNCPYWHGVFGGLYLPHIRQAIYSELLKVEEKLTDSKKFVVLEFDYDTDGQSELVATNGCFSTVFKPSHGGTLTELSLLKEHFNLTDTLSRRQEGYHHKLLQAAKHSDTGKTASIHDSVTTKEANLDTLLVNDWYLKRCFIDHFFGDDTTLEMFKKNKFAEEGDFILEPFASEVDEKNEEIIFTRKGTIRRDDSSHKVSILKSFKFENNLLHITYKLSTERSEEISVLFGIENNFNFQAGHAEDRFVLIDGSRPENSFLDSVRETLDSASFAMIDEYRQLAVALKSERSSKLWQCPIFTVSMSEGGFEKVYQGTTLVNLFHLKLSSKPVTFNLTLFAGSLTALPSEFSKESVFTAQS